MNDDLFDARVRFYLEHRDDIERWAALRVDAQSAVSDWLRGLKEPLAELADSLDSQPRVVEIPAFSAVGLSLPRWPATIDGPSVAVALGWFNNRSNHPDGYLGTVRPYVGIWTADTGLEESLRSAAVAAGLGGQGWGRTWQQWPAWRWLPGTPQTWWRDLAAEGDRLVTAFAELWPMAGPVIDATLRSGPRVPT